MADFNEFLIYKFHASLTRYFEHLDLWLHKQVEGEFWYKETGSRTSRVSDSCANVKNRKVLCGINGLK